MGLTAGKAGQPGFSGASGLTPAGGRSAGKGKKARSADSVRPRLRRGVPAAAAAVPGRFRNGTAPAGFGPSGNLSGRRPAPPAFPGGARPAPGSELTALRRLRGSWPAGPAGQAGLPDRCALKGRGRRIRHLPVSCGLFRRLRRSFPRPRAPPPRPAADRRDARKSVPETGRFRGNPLRRGCGERPNGCLSRMPTSSPPAGGGELRRPLPRHRPAMPVVDPRLTCRALPRWGSPVRTPRLEALGSPREQCG